LEVNDSSSPFLDGNVGLRTFRQNKVVFEEVSLWQGRPTNPIIQDILENIQKSRLIIAFVTESNPNVLYEIGVAHTLKKDVIIVTPDVNKLPFDIRHLRCIQYEDSLAGSEKLKTDLKLTVEQVLSI
jgi:hypothetical protein